ncbi:Rieske (2Fe-2S) protein [Zooshikella ganghwensis]|nr:Rieske (2Fe-2S) protein [Zooshikella ganghwensis]
MSDESITLCTVDEIPPNTSKGFTVGKQTIFVVNRAGQFHAYLNRCPHLGIRLEWQPDQFLDTDARLIQCATHGALFLIETGLCIAGPCAGQHLTKLACHSSNQQICVTLPLSSAEAH